MLRRNSPLFSLARHRPSLGMPYRSLRQPCDATSSEGFAHISIHGLGQRYCLYNFNRDPISMKVIDMAKLMSKAIVNP